MFIVLSRYVINPVGVECPARVSYFAPKELGTPGGIYYYKHRTPPGLPDGPLDHRSRLPITQVPLLIAPDAPAPPPAVSLGLGVVVRSNTNDPTRTSPVTETARSMRDALSVDRVRIGAACTRSSIGRFVRNGVLRERGQLLL